MLDRYAAEHPDVVRVFHQENSGGPAKPCNVGLAAARGRFVFFIGSDDYLAEDGLERMVTAADAWGSDVVVPAMVGVNGRSVDQRLFGRDQPEVPFPHSDLAFSLSNTKLFRRALLEEHGIRYPLDLRIGSDQPFAIAAMLAAKRISVLAKPHIYFAVRRERDDNIIYSTTWRDRLDAVRSVLDHVCEILPPGDDRDALLRRHFTWDLHKIVARNLADLAPEDRPAMLAELAGVADALLTPGVERRLGVRPRLTWWHVRRGDVEATLAHLGSTAEAVVHVEGDSLFFALPGFREGVPDDLFRPTDADVPKRVRRSLGDQGALIEDDRLVVWAQALQITPESLPALAMVLVPVSGAPAPPRQVPAAAAVDEAVLTTQVDRVAPDRVTAALDLRELARRPGRWALRWQLRVGDAVYDLPVRSTATSSASVRRRFRTTEVHLQSCGSRRAVVEVRS